MMRVSVSVAVGLFLGMGSSAFAQSPSAKIPTGNDYRLNIEFNSLAADSTIRFPKVSTGSNNLIDQQAANQGNRTAVNWVHLTMLNGSVDQLVIIYAPAFPAGKDTVRLTQAGRTFSFGGCPIESLRVIGGTGDMLSILATD